MLNHSMKNLTLVIPAKYEKVTLPVEKKQPEPVYAFKQDVTPPTPDVEGEVV